MKSSRNRVKRAPPLQKNKNKTPENLAGIADKRKMLQLAKRWKEHYFVETVEKSDENTKS